MPELTTSPWQAAVDRLSSKTVVGSRLRTEEWSQMPIALRDGAFFSAGVEETRVLSAMRDKLSGGLQQIRTDGILQNKARFVADMRRMLGAAPGDTGDLTDITSVRRLSLIWDFQQKDVHGFAARKADMDPDALDAFPAYRLIRVESRRVPRHWLQLWGVAGEKVGWEGASKTEMVALKWSPIWIALSRFGKPWPPFDYDSGMGLEDVDREETESLGLLDKNQSPADRQQQLREASATDAQEWDDNLQASVKGISDTARAWLKDAFGDQIAVDGDRVQWTGGGAVVATPAPATSEIVPEKIPLADVDRVTTAAAKAGSREEAHAIVALPPAERGSLRLNPTDGAKVQATKAKDFISTILHRDVAPLQTCKIAIYLGGGEYLPELQAAYVRSGDLATTVHELAHHIECTNPKILQASKDFIRSRLAPGEKPRRLRDITGLSKYPPTWIAYEDEWEARGGRPYSGRVYGGSLDDAPATEVISTGLERLYEDPVKFAQQDPDFFKFILSILRP